MGLLLIITGIVALGACVFAARMMFLYARTRGRLSPLEHQLEISHARGEELQRLLDGSREEKVAALTQLTHMKEQWEARQKEQEQARLQFENLANKIFEEKNAQSKKNLQELLTPLKEDLTGFKKHITESFGTQAKEQFALKKEIESIVKVSREMTVQTESLSKALKGDSKVQGSWGEITLERILEASGLRKNEDYIAQGTEMGLKHAEDGRTQKPDFIIYLPEDKHVVIDSKVSLTAYEKFCGEENDELKPAHLAQFIASVKTHVKGLQERRYQDSANLGTPDFVLMFMPIEGAYALAMQHSPELHSDAWERKIVIVCPSTLFATLRTIASVWRMERQNQNTQKIAERGGRLYDKVAGFVEDMLKLGKQLGMAQHTYDDALGKLKTGPGNVLKQAEQLRELGVKNSKTISPQLIDSEQEEVPQLPEEAA